MLRKFGLAMILAVTAGWSFYRYHCQGKRDPLSRNSKTPATLVEPLLLPVFVLLLAVVIPAAGGRAAALELARTFLMLFLQISVYFAVLLCLLPLLRRRISARACAVLWLLPNLLYVTFNINHLARTEPLFLLALPSPPIQKALVVLWLAGFGAVLLWQVVSHLRFRRRLLKTGETVTDSLVLACRDQERWRGNIHRDIPLLWSDEIRTPVTVGCFASTVVLVLPRREYTREELELIFRHEFRHIKRADMRTKVFLAFCTAICWFNPLMWLARRKASEDLELSCDEEVLKDADEAARRRYAELLLQTAGDSRGFSTCLSAGASSLRYRLKNVISPRKKHAGAVCVTAALLVLLMSGGAVAFAEQSGTVKDVIFGRYPPGKVIDSIAMDTWEGGRSGYRGIYGWQEEALMEYIGSLRVRRVYSNGYDTGDREGRRLSVEYTVPDGTGVEAWTYFVLWDGILKANIPYDGNINSLPYLVEDEVDWDYVESLLDFDAPAPDLIPQPPRLAQVHFIGEGAEVELYLDLAGEVLGGIRGGEEIENGAYYEGSGPSGLSGFPVTEARLIFPQPPDGIYEVRVENWDRTYGYTILSSDMEKDSFSLAPYSAHYTVYAQFAPSDDTVYEMSYSFDIELPEA